MISLEFLSGSPTHGQILASLHETRIIDAARRQAPARNTRKASRAEVTPCSDLDFAFLFHDAIEGNAFLFVDMRPVFDPSGLADSFRERIQSTFDPFEHFLHVRHFWKRQWEAAAAASERLDRFDIKNDTLRIFFSGIWTMLAVATLDYRGLAASISGALWQSQVELRQAHLFSAMNHGLALDFFHLAPGKKPLPKDLLGIVEDAILVQRHIAESDEAGLPRIDGRFTLTESRPDQHCLRFETSRDAGGLRPLPARDQHIAFAFDWCMRLQGVWDSGTFGFRGPA